MIFGWKFFIFIFVIICIIANEEYNIAKNKKRDLSDKNANKPPLNESK